MDSSAHLTSVGGMHRLDGRRAVVRMGFAPKQHRHVDAEATALRTLHALHGADVPRLLAHGYTREGFAYVITEYIDVSSVACLPGYFNLLTSSSCSHIPPKDRLMVLRASISSGCHASGDVNGILGYLAHETGL